VEDIPLLGKHFLQRFANKTNHHGLQLTREHESMMTAYKWPGNVRELQNVLERSVLLSTDGYLHLNLPSGNRVKTNDPFNDLPSLNDIQRRYIQYVLEKTNGKLSGIGGATEILGMKRTSLYNRMKKLGLR
jgi:DNA-binding NtrC family response regulator